MAGRAENLLPHFTKGAAWTADDLLVIDRGEGCYIWDTDDNMYLDGLAGLFCTNIGHGRSDLTAAAAKQMDQLAFYPNWGSAHPPSIEASAMIAERAPGDLDEVFFVSSGSEAVESAVKFARNLHVARGESSRYKVIARDWAYHGTTLGALAVTGIPKFKTTFEPMLWDGTRHVMNTRGCSVPEGTPASELECAKAIEAKILEEGPETVSMVIVEPVQNGGGALVPPTGYLQEVRRICDRHGVLMVCDEVINSFGRLGHWFGSIRYDVVPDIITFAKGVTSAYLPLGGMVVRRPLVEQMWESEVAMFNHGSTFGGHPVSTAVAVANIRAMDDENVLGNVLAHEAEFMAGLESLAAAHPTVREIRGTGYFYAVDLMADSTSGQELSDIQNAGLQGGALNSFIRESKLLVRPDDRGYTGLTISPPLVADSGVIADLLGRVDQILDRTDDWMSSPV